MPWRVAGAGQDAGAQPAGRGADTRPPSDDAESRKRETSESADLEYGDSPLRPQGVSVDFIGVLGGGGAGGWRKLLGVIYCFYWCNIPYNVRGEFVAARIRSINSITWADAAAGTRDGRVITYRIPISII